MVATLKEYEANVRPPTTLIRDGSVVGDLIG